jgi:ABC-type nitrate/sulfonate/bicarbonate transport system substrate-binding protein
VTDGASLHEHARKLPPGQRLTFGVTFEFATSHLHLRTWLRSAGFVPDRDIRIVVVPPSQLLRHLAAGTLDGWCADQPWNSLAVRAGTGWCPGGRAAQHPGHVDKVLMVTRRFAEEHSDTHAALVQAITAAAQWCQEPQNHDALAKLLADARWLNLPEDLLAPMLSGNVARGTGASVQVPDFHAFGRDGVGAPTVDAAIDLQDALGAAGLLSPFHAAQRELPPQLFREDLSRALPRLPDRHAVSGG